MGIVCFAPFTSISTESCQNSTGFELNSTFSFPLRMKSSHPLAETKGTLGAAALLRSVLAPGHTPSNSKATMLPACSQSANEGYVLLVYRSELSRRDRLRRLRGA